MELWGIRCGFVNGCEVDNCFIFNFVPHRFIFPHTGMKLLVLFRGLGRLLHSLGVKFLRKQLIMKQFAF